MKLKIIITIFLFFSGNSYAVGSQERPVFFLSADCVKTIEITEAEYAPVYVLIITLNDEATKKLETFSKKHINDFVRMVNGNGDKISEYDSVIRDMLSSPFQVTSDSKEKAEIAKDLIISSVGNCGEK